MQIKGFIINYDGDPSVGIPSDQWKIEGFFDFDDENHLEEYKKKLHEAWEVFLDTPIRVIIRNSIYSKL